MRLFLAGASGLVGRALVPLLLADGHQVVGTTRDPARADAIRALGAQPVVVDVYDRAGLAAAVRAARPDLVIHQLTDLSRMDLAANDRLRRVGTRNLVDAARAADVRRIVTQSIAFVYAPGDGLAREDDPLYLDAPEPSRETALAVAAMEQASAELPECVVLRYGLFYGPGTGFAPGGMMAELVQRGQVPANENVTSFLHIEDAVAAAQQAVGWSPGIYNIVDDEPAAATVWLPQYAAALGAPPPRRVSGRDPLMSRGASNEKARRALGWAPRHPTWRTTFAQALR